MKKRILMWWASFAALYMLVVHMDWVERFGEVCILLACAVVLGSAAHDWYTARAIARSRLAAFKRRVTNAEPTGQEET